MLTAFRTIYICAILLCLAAATLVTASLFIADRAPQSGQYFWTTIVVGGFFLAIGVLLFGIQRHGSGLVREAMTSGRPASMRFAAHAFGLLLYLSLGGLSLCAILGIMTYAILARINQGFAVFG